MRDTDAAWLAGIIDGEGSLMISREEKKDMVYPWLDAIISVCNTDRRILDKCVELAGGFIVDMKTNATNPKWKNAWYWRVKGTNVTPILNAVLPYLVAKRDQAELLLALRAMTRRGSPKGRFGTRKTPEEAAAREAIWAQVRELNHRGSPLNKDGVSA